MKKTLLFSFIAAAAAVSAAPTDAHALNTCKPAFVTILNGYAAVPLGTWVSELMEYTDCNGYEACSYFVKWIDAAFALPITSNLWIDELIVPGYADCELNSITNFRTVIFNSPDYVSVGFNKFGQKTVVQNMILSSDGFGRLSGILMTNTNFPYSLVVEDP